MADQGDPGDENDEAWRESLELAPPPPAGDGRPDAKQSAQNTWAAILASLTPDARRQDALLQTYLEQKLGMKL